MKSLRRLAIAGPLLSFMAGSTAAQSPNLTAAKAIKVEVPATMIALADQIIE